MAVVILRTGSLTSSRGRMTHREVLVEVLGGLLVEEAPECARTEPIPDQHMSADMLPQNHLQDARAAVSPSSLCCTSSKYCA